MLLKILSLECPLYCSCPPPLETIFCSSWKRDLCHPRFLKHFYERFYDQSIQSVSHCPLELLINDLDWIQKETCAGRRFNGSKVFTTIECFIVPNATGYQVWTGLSHLCFWKRILHQDWDLHMCSHACWLKDPHEPRRQSHCNSCLGILRNWRNRDMVHSTRCTTQYCTDSWRQTAIGSPQYHSCKPRWMTCVIYE